MNEQRRRGRLHTTDVLCVALVLLELQFVAVDRLVSSCTLWAC